MHQETKKCSEKSFPEMISLLKLVDKFRDQSCHTIYINIVNIALAYLLYYNIQIIRIDCIISVMNKKKLMFIIFLIYCDVLIGSIHFIICGAIIFFIH